MKAIYNRIMRALLATAVPQLVVFIPGAVEILPPPWNLLLTPALMGIAKGLRNAYPEAKWVTYIPF